MAKAISSLFRLGAENISSKNLLFCFFYGTLTRCVLRPWQRWSRGHKARGQGQGQPFRGQTLSRPKDRNARGQGPRTQAQVLSKKKKKGLPKNVSSDLHKKNVIQKNFQVLHKILTIQKIVLSSSRGQANFRGLEASRPRPRTSKCVLEAKDVLEDSTSGPWPGAFLSLASRGSFLGRCVLGLGFFCVLGLGLEPYVVDSTSDDYLLAYRIY